MGIIGNRAFELLSKISYERLGGSNEELAALKIIQDEINVLNIPNEIEEFDVEYSLEFKFKPPCFNFGS